MQRMPINKYLILSIAAILLTRKAMAATKEDKLKILLPKLEGFTPKPFWDFKQWTWGYGTRVPGSSNNKNITPSGTITKAAAMDAALKHIQSDFVYLSSLINITLSPAQWAALLSFSYNLGKGKAYNLVQNINADNKEALEVQWKKYIYAGGQVSTGLKARRAKEWDLWSS